MTPPEATPKPTLWQRATGAVKNFFSHAIGYIPRGIVFTGFVFAVSAAIETATGATGLGISRLNNPELLTRFLGHMALGGALSGLIGATTTPCTPCAQTGATAACNNPLLSKREAQLGEYVAKTLGDQATKAAQTAAVEAVVPGGGLPAQLINKALAQQPSR